MTTRQLMQRLGIQHLTPRDVRRVEEAFDASDLETALTTVDALLGKREALHGAGRRARTVKTNRSERRA